LRCSVCSSQSLPDVDYQLAAGRSSASIAAEFSLGREAVKRHARNHSKLAPEPAEAPSDGADPLTELAASLRTRALAGSDNASREYRLALSALAERGLARPAYNVLEDPEWIAIRTETLSILYDQFPEARMALIHAWEKPR
jgi:hypothetical protein